MRRAAARLRGTIPHGDSPPAAEFWRRHRMITLLLWVQIAALVPFGLLEGFTVPATLVDHGGSAAAWGWAGIHVFFVAAATVVTLIAWRHLGAARAQAEENARAQSAARRAAEAVVAAADERARRELEARASTDPLTGLANHRAFQERVFAEAQRAHRHDRELALVVFDIDHFTRINDTYGHPVGDAVLVEVARRLREQVRPGDVLARIGGDELAWLMPDAGALDAWEAAERARRRIVATPFPTVGSLTISAGTADLAQADLAGELVQLAGRALHWAKRNGRDVTFLYSSEVHAGLDMEEQNERLARAQALQSLRALVQSQDAKHPTTRRHCEGVADLAVALAGARGWDGDRADELREAALLHDLGMLTVPDEILLKPAGLSEEEYTRVRTHAAAGAQMASEVLSAEQVSWIRGHHERHDGLGYPDGLAGSAIPEGAMILALADAWETMTSARPYRPPRSAEDALAECRRCAGRQFTPEVVAALEGLLASGALQAIRPEWSGAAASR